MAFVRDDRRPGAVTAAHLAVGLQIVLLVETTIIGAVFSSFFDLFRNAWFWHIAPTFSGYVLAPAIAAVVLLLIPLCLVLYHVAFGRPALIVGEVLVCIPAVAFAAHAAPRAGRQHPRRPRGGVRRARGAHHRDAAAKSDEPMAGQIRTVSGCFILTTRSPRHGC